MKDNANSRIILFNTSNSNIGTITDDQEYREKISDLLYKKYSIDIKNIPVYYVWDRDAESNSQETVRDLLTKLNSPYDNDVYENGLLLLSYPAIEAFTISLFKKNVDFLHNRSAKQFVTEEECKIKRINRNMLKKAVADYDIKCRLLEVEADFTVSEFGKINRDIFEKEEMIYGTEKEY